MKHASDCGCDVCSKDSYETELGIRRNIAKREEGIQKWQKAIKMMEFLEIPCSGAYYYEDHINASKLYDILMDKEKLRILVSKLRNKALW